jgi:hypothetical protein
MDGGRTARRPRTARDRGAVLIVVMLIMLTLLGLGVVTLWLTSSNLQLGGTMNLRTQALYVAEAGIERARAVMNAPVAPDVDALLAGSNPGIDEVPQPILDLDASGLPTKVGALLVHNGVSLRDVSFPPASFARSAGTAAAPVATTMGRYTVWIRRNLSELRGGPIEPPERRTVVIRSRGVASDGRTNVVLEVTMLPAVSLGGAPTPGSGALSGDCIAGKNSCDDNSSTQYGITYGGP